MGGKNTPPGTFEQIYESVKHYDVEVVNKGFQTGGYAVLKTTKLEHAWWWFDWLKIIGIYTGKKTGPARLGVCPFPCQVFDFLSVFVTARSLHVPEF